ncbi:hypothetical protein ACWEOI_34920 [Nocardia sp. NPDC004340]|uniref:hypothetical protein n=1 Tax=Nocardia sp. CA-136227 TaxID=3239979 RepID=UPI003D95382C
MKKLATTSLVTLGLIAAMGTAHAGKDTEWQVDGNYPTEAACDADGETGTFTRPDGTQLVPGDDIYECTLGADGLWYLSIWTD